MWMPFDVRFAELTELLSQHRQSLNRILEISTMATLSDETKVASMNRQETAAEWARSQEE
jgi:hypothetical protein